MRAVVFEQFGGPVEVREVDDPPCPADGVVVEVAATGLCRSDWHGWVGHDPDIALPHVPGHELAGVVVQVGPDVATVAVGDRVTVPFVCACGRCGPCLAGEHQVCDDQLQPGFTGWGSFAELVALHRADVNVVHLPDDVSFDSAASLGCRFATAYRAIDVHARAHDGDWVAVHGCGGVGLSAVVVAVARGARVVAVDVQPVTLAMATQLGATATVDAKGMTAAQVADAVRDVTGGGAHVSLDALGSLSTCRASILGLRPRGRHVQVGLMLADDDLPPLPMATVIARELELYGSHGMAAHSYPAMLEEVRSGRLRPADLVTRHLGLDELPAALTAMDRDGHSGVTLVHPAGARH